MKSKGLPNKRKPAVKKARSSSTGVTPQSAFPIVAIGASAGGLAAITELLGYLPSDTGMAFIYVQHLSPDHKSMLSEILSKTTQMQVQEIDEMVLIQPDHVFVIPHNKAIAIAEGHIRLMPRSKSKTAVTIDTLFSSLALAHKERVIGIVLSGTASDGTVGLKTIKQEGGVTFAQDETAQFTGMPEAAIAAGVVDFTLSPKDIASELTRISKHFLKIQGVKARKEDLIEDDDPVLVGILQHIYKATKVDFRNYKTTTLKRRILRRMLIHRLKTLSEYKNLLIDRDEETQLLYHDLLINVTSFLRDTEGNKYLKDTLLPNLLKGKKQGEQLRIWVPACATGEEAYSLAILILEIQESTGSATPVQIFASDLSAQAINKARSGLYSKQELEIVPAHRLERFFVKSNVHYHVNKTVREMCIFAHHNLLIDPPFSRLDFISCQNLFIYLDASAQIKALSTFHYALNDAGYLMLGKSETIGSTPQLFKDYNKKFKVFTRINGADSRKQRESTYHFPVQGPKEPTKQTVAPKKTTVETQNLDHAIDSVLISEFVPASVVVNYDMDVQQFRGSTDVFLTHPPGKASLNILKLARKDLVFALRKVISDAIRLKKGVRKNGIEMKVNARLRFITIEAVPLKFDWHEPLILVVFRLQDPVEAVPGTVKSNKNTSAEKDRRIKKLEEELKDARAEAHALAQSQEAIHDELQGANEEVMSSNEELQTTNEELATSKEELESTNEELTTTNQELHTRYEQLTEAHEFSEAIIGTMHDALLILDKDFRVKSANKSFYTLFRVEEDETLGHLLFELGNRQWDIPSLRELLEFVIPKNTTIQNFEITHDFHGIGEKSVLLNANRITQKTNSAQLILLATADVTELKRKAAEVQLLREQQHDLETLRIVAESVPALIWMSDLDKQYIFFNQTWLNFTGRTTEQELGDGWIEGVHPDDRERCLEIYFNAFDNREDFYMEYRLRRHDGEYRWVSDKGIPRLSAEQIFEGYSGGCMDIHTHKMFALEMEKQVNLKTTELKETNASLKQSEERFQLMVNEVEDYAIIYLSPEGIIENWNKGAEKLKGYKADEIVGKYFNIFYTERDNKARTTSKLLKQAIKKGSARFEGWRVRKDGSTFWGTSVITALFDERKHLLGFSKVTRDLTIQKEAEDNIKEVNRLLSNKTNQLIEAQNLAHIGSWDWDIPANKIEWTDELLRIYGLTAQEFQDNFHDFLKYIHPDDREYLQNTIQEAMKKQQPYDFFHRIIHADGTTRVLRSTGKVFADRKGNLIRMAGTAQDVTKQKKYEAELKESEERFLKIFDNNPVPMTLTELESSKIQYVNDGFCSTFGYDRDEVIGRTSQELQLTSPEETQRLVSLILHFTQKNYSMEEMISLSVEEKEDILIKLKQSERNLEVLYTRKNGTTFPALVTYEIINIGNEKYTIASYQNIAERKKSEIVLKNKNDELEKMNKELQSFAHVSSHDLQEPLRKIRTFAGRILEKEHQNLSENGKHQFDRMILASKRMQTLIDDLLTYSRTNSMERVFEYTDLNVLVEEVKAEMREELRQKRAVIKTNEMCSLNVIPFQFRQLLYNLIGNSLKFSHPTRQPRINITCTFNLGIRLNNKALQPQSTYCHIVVSDNGIGFDQQYSLRIFDVFQRLHGRSDYKGTGIGLSIVKKIVENHDGIIIATGEPNKGATFDIYIPVR